MPIPKSTNLTAYDFTPDEFYAATRLTQLQLMFLQTLLAEAVEEKGKLTVDLKDTPDLQQATMKFMQREAEQTGTIGAYAHLINLFLTTEVPTPNSKE